MSKTSAEGFLKTHFKIAIKKGSPIPIASPKRERSSSDELNKIFLPILDRLDQKIRRRRWLKHPTIIPKNNATEIKKEIPRQSTYSAHPDIFVQLPTRLTYDKLFVSFKAPIGEYGETWARRLILAATTLAHEAINIHSTINIRRDLRKTNLLHSSLLKKYTFRSIPNILKGMRESKYGAQATLIEGFQSILYVAGFLTAYKIPGYENNPDQLLLDLTRDGVFSQLSLATPTTATATMGNNGLVFPNPTIIKQHDKFILNKNLTLALNKLKRSEFKYQTTGAEDRLDKSGCPLGRKREGKPESGVDIAARLLAETVMAQKNLI